MKPTENQVRLIKKIASEIAWLENSNDLDSPSHWNLIDEFVMTDLPFNEDIELSKGEQEMLANALTDILLIIRKNK